MPEPLALTRHGATAVLELARPDKFNCLSGALHAAIAAALDTAENDPACRAVLIAAQGRHFCTGADLAEVQALRATGRFDAFIAQGHRVLCRLEASPLPVVMAVQGLCLAGGLELALAGDVILAAEGAKFGDQHAQYGLVPGWGGSQRLPRRVGLTRALDLMFSARWLAAAEARDWGLVAQVVPDAELRQQALAYCEQLATRSRPGLAAMKRLARQGADLPLTDALTLEQRLALEAMAGPDVDEGLAAFGERRPPRFS
ncbi:enoyl-CoA hydratase/isomerase family protein [Immundisolibacter sp.]|uniref:enoyl-CoA hydratase/isomerase family protein n=1 Tax=Immundisolibacter sp. TaxID=1934948 RepID=UPI000EC7A872|nr:enoyl-CoA hydratase/isomerase family protein [Gammaproteobacteria bacterium]